MRLNEEQSEAKEVAYLDSYKRNRYCKSQKANSGAYSENYEKIKWGSHEKQTGKASPQDPSP